MTGSAAGSQADLDIAVCGASGRVGRRMLELIGARTLAWRAAGCRPRLVALANSRQAVPSRSGTDALIAIETYRLCLKEGSRPRRTAAHAAAR